MEKTKVDIEELLLQGKTIQLKPIGFSMCPLIAPNRDEAVIAPIAGHKLKRGDVVLYRRVGSILVLHRIWKCKKNGYYMVGDNQCEIEGPLSGEQIKGIMVAVIRKGKHISVKNLWYRLGSGLWLWLRPIRPVVSRVVWGIIRKVRH